MYIPVVFMGGQYNHLIVRALKELGVDSRLIMPNTRLTALKGVDGLVMGGGPHSVYDGMDKFRSASEIIEGAGFPILGICLSHQLIGKLLGGDVVKGRKPEYGKTVIEVIEPDDILQGVGEEFVAWASHNDEVRKDGGRFSVLARSEYCEVEALKGDGRPIYGVQFHIEVSDTPKGKTILRNFINLCRC
jgi:GMP synthase (glutamine-hydrolysing)